MFYDGKLFIIVIIIIITNLVVVGYYYSDIRKFNKIIEENNIKTPHEVYIYVKSIKQKAHNGDMITAGCTPYYLLKVRKKLWCDEFCVVMSTFNNILGYNTRLVDIIGTDNLSHHTVLQVDESNKWTLYDGYMGIHCANIEKTVNYHVSSIRIRQYPKLYNFIVNNNYFIKELFVLIRGIDENYPIINNNEKINNNIPIN